MAYLLILLRTQVFLAASDVLSNTAQVTLLAEKEYYVIFSSTEILHSGYAYSFHLAL